MKRGYVFGVIVSALLLAAFVCLYGGSQTPSGQPPLQGVTAQSAGDIKNAFNAASGDTRIVLLLSPT
jgi:hypothetical protein